MENEIRAGVDVGPIELDLMVGMDEQRHHLERIAKVLESSVRTPTHRTLSAAASADGAGFVTLAFRESPPTGRYWCVVRHSISGQDPEVEFTGIVVRLYRGQVGSAFALVDWSNRAPDVGTWEEQQLTAQPQETFTMTASGLSEGDSIVATMDVIEREIGREEV